MVQPSKIRRVLSGAYWVSWVNTYTPTSKEIKALNGSFQTGVIEFKRALETGGATVTVSHTYRSDQAAYLWHWAWKIAKRKCAPIPADSRSPCTCTVVPGSVARLMTFLRSAP